MHVLVSFHVHVAACLHSAMHFTTNFILSSPASTTSFHQLLYLSPVSPCLYCILSSSFHNRTSCSFIYLFHVPECTEGIRQWSQCSQLCRLAPDSMAAPGMLHGCRVHLKRGDNVKLTQYDSADHSFVCAFKSEVTEADFFFFNL